MDFLKSHLMEKIKFTALINLYSLAKLPLLAFITPEFVEMSDQRCVVKVRRDYRTRNHLNSMYFGALAMGAELSIAAAAIQAIQESGQRIDFIFKDFEAKFLKRGDAHVLFTCEHVQQVKELVNQAARSSERFEKTFDGFAQTVKSDEPIMKYRLTLSVKNRSTKT
jgi:acyl-coenzyme A thioesterase PaaI-like protein